MALQYIINLNVSTYHVVCVLFAVVHLPSPARFLAHLATNANLGRGDGAGPSAAADRRAKTADSDGGRSPKRSTETDADRSAAPEMPASAIRAIPGGRRTAPSRSHSAGHRGEDRNRARDHRAMVARTGISGAPDSQRSTTRLSPRRSKAGAQTATITDPDPLFGWACGGTSQHATANALSSADKTSRRVLTILPEGSPVTSVRSPVSSHAEMAKR